MKSYKVDVRIGGDMTHTVCGKRVSVPELALLRLIHGPENVSNVRDPEDVADYLEDIERERLTAIYDAQASEENGSRMERLFGLTARLPVTLKDIGIDAKAAARDAEAAAKAAQARAAELAAQADADEASAEEVFS